MNTLLSDYDRMMKKIAFALLIIVLLSYAGLQITGHGYLLTAVSRTYLQGHLTANIDDHVAFDTRRINADNSQPWPTHARYPVPLETAFANDLAANDAIAFLVIHKGQLVAEQYFGDYTPASKTNSFSMAKTVVTLLLGTAIEEGLIDSLAQPLTDWLPEFDEDPLAANATIGSLSDMTSGYEWDEHYYSPLSPTVKLLYGDDVSRFVLAGEFTREPGSYFYYSSASTQLLAVALTRALRQQDNGATLSNYLQQTLWRPLGMNDSALWHLDGQGMELAYCCLNTNARNFAKFGQLMLQRGQWRGQQLVPAAFIDAMTAPRKVDYYGYSTWLTYDHDPAYYSFSGHLGQFIIVVPEHDVVIVRLGRSMPYEDSMSVLDSYVDEALRLLPPGDGAGPVRGQ